MFIQLAMLVGVALLVMVSNIAITVLYMVVYGHLLDPGHEKQYYHDHVKLAAPYCAIVAGMPLMFLAGWWVSRWWDGTWGFTPALIVWLTYALINLVVTLASGMTTRIAVFVVVSLLTQLAAVCLGAWFFFRGA